MFKIYFVGRSKIVNQLIIKEKQIVLVLGGSGRLGKEIKKRFINFDKIDIFFTKRSKKFEIDLINNIIFCEFSDQNHLDLIFSFFGKIAIIDCSVFRNPMHIKEIRDFGTFTNEIKKISWLMHNQTKISAYCLMSSVSVYKEYEDIEVSVDLIISVIKEFIDFYHKNDFKIFNFSMGEFSEVKSYWREVSPMNHAKDNLRLNGQSKFISEVVAFEMYQQFKKKIYILRAPRIKYLS